LISFYPIDASLHEDEAKYSIKRNSVRGPLIGLSFVVPPELFQGWLKILCTLPAYSNSHPTVSLASSSPFKAAQKKNPVSSNL